MHPVGAQSLLLSSSWSRLEKDALLINSVKLTVKYFEAAALQTSGPVNIVYFSNGEWSTQLWTQLMQLCKKPIKKFRTSTGFEPVTLRYQCNALTNWAMKSLMLGAGQLCLCLENHTSISRSRVQISLKSCIFFFRLLTQLHKSRSQLRGSFFIWFHFRSSYMIYFIYIYHIVYFCQMFLECKHPFIDRKPMVIFEATVPGASMDLTACMYAQALLDAYWKLYWLKTIDIENIYFISSL